MYRLKKSLLPVFCAVLVTQGCSGDLSGDDDADAANVQPLLVGTPAQGYLTISETEGRGIVDAYFSHYALPSVERELIWSQDEAACYQTMNPDESAFGSGSSPFFASLVSAGDRISVDTRGGVFLSVLAHEIDGLTTYAPDARWVDVDFPDDATLGIAGSEFFPAMQGLALQSLTPMERLLPENGSLVAGDSLISWVPDEQPVDTVQIILKPRRSSEHYLNSETALFDSLICIVRDTGSFQLPSAIIAAMGEHLSVSVSLTRRRTTVHDNREGHTLTVMQISHG